MPWKLGAAKQSCRVADLVQLTSEALPPRVRLWSWLCTDLPPSTLLWSALVYPGTSCCNPSVRLSPMARVMRRRTAPPPMRIPRALSRSARTRSMTASPASATASRGMPAPAAKASVSSRPAKLRWLVAPITEMAARMGPAQGTKTAPRPRPRTNPPREVAGWGAWRRRKGRSRILSIAGTSRLRPKTPRTTRPASRSRSWGSLRALSTVVPRRVMKLKLTTRPTTTATERHRREAGAVPVAPATRTMGSTGRMQGEMPVMSSATKPTTRRLIITFRESSLPTTSVQPAARMGTTHLGRGQGGGIRHQRRGEGRGPARRLRAFRHRATTSNLETNP